MKAELRNFIVRSTSDGGLTFKSDYHRGIFKQLLKDLQGKDIWLTLDSKKPKRSDRQNRYYWLYLNIIAEETGHDPIELHIRFKDEFLFDKEEEVMGRPIRLTKSTTDLSKTEFGEYMERISVLVEVPLPDASIFDLAPLK